MSKVLFLFALLFAAGCSSEFKSQLKAVEEILVLNGIDPSIARAISATSDNVNVTSINLQNDSLRVIPDAIGRLHSVRRINFNFNQIESISEAIGRCTALVSLELVGNRLTALPDAIGTLKSLEVLELRNNLLEYLPESFGNLHNLKTLTLQRNRLKQLPENFGELRSIGRVHLNQNMLETLPPSFALLRTVEIALDDNLFLVFPAQQLFPRRPQTYTGIGLSGNPIDSTSIPDLVRRHCSMWRDGIFQFARDKDSVLRICHTPVDESALFANTE